MFRVEKIPLITPEGPPDFAFSFDRWGIEADLIELRFKTEGKAKKVTKELNEVLRRHEKENINR